jgi:hypothetical protein
MYLPNCTVFGDFKKFPHHILNQSPTELITVRGCCDQVKENLGFIKGGEFLDQLEIRHALGEVQNVTLNVKKFRWI